MMAGKRFVAACLAAVLVIGFADDAPVPAVALAEEDQTAEERANADAHLSPEAHETLQHGRTMLHQILKEMEEELSSPHVSHQFFNATIALVVGVVLCVNGEFMFRQMIVLCIFVATTILAIADLKMRNLNYQHGWRLIVLYVVAGEIGLIAAIAANLGFKGVKFMLGAGVGMAGARALEDILFPIVAGSPAQHAIDNLWTKCVLGTVFVFLGVWLINGTKAQRVQALIGAIFGGGLITSVVVFVVQTITVLEQDSLKASMEGFVIPKTPYPWLDYLELVFEPEKKERSKLGVFAGSKLDKDSGLRLDLVGAYFLWVVVSALGFRYQLKMEAQGGNQFINKATRTLERTVSDTIDKGRNLLKGGDQGREPLLQKGAV